MASDDFNRGLLDFLDASPTPFHAVANLAAALRGAGFQPLDETEAWRLEPGGRYYLSRGGSLVGFVYGRGPRLDSGLRMVATHTDSPCLRLRPRPDTLRHGYLQLGVEVYGGALLNPWFDRDLSIAGRVVARRGETLETRLVDFRRPLAVIPSLAIHLDREANKSRSVNPQTDILPLLLQYEGEAPEFGELLKIQLQAQYPDAALDEVVSFDLSLYDTQGAAYVGLNQEFIASARLDNLLSCYVGLRALCGAGDALTTLLACSDHEEVGSMSQTGAQGNFLGAVLERVCGGGEDGQRALRRSLLLSADNSHGLHPNYPDRHDSGHAPRLNHGPALKTNPAQRYASDGETVALARELARRLGVPLQDFAIRADLTCGSTVGPFIAARLGVPALDLGVPTLAMHSIRELAGCDDARHLYRLLQGFFDPAQPLRIRRAETA